MTIFFQACANSIALIARKLSQDENFLSPFAKNARANGFGNVAGGKVDDVTVVLAAVSLNENKSLGSSSWYWKQFERKTHSEKSYSFAQIALKNRRIMKKQNSVMWNFFASKQQTKQFIILMTAIFSIYFSGGINLLSKFPNFFKKNFWR